MRCTLVWETPSALAIVIGTDYDTPDGTCIRDDTHVTELAYPHVKALSASMAPTQSPL